LVVGLLLTSLQPSAADAYKFIMTLLLLLFTITIYGFDLLMLLAYAHSMPPLFSLPLSMACDDSDGCHEKPALHAFKASIFPFNIKLFRLAVISLNDLDKVTLSICIVAGFDDWRFAAGHVVRVHGYGGKANPIVMHVLGFDADTYTHLRDERKRRWSQKKWEDIFRKLMKGVTEKQEELQTTFLDTLERRKRNEWRQKRCGQHKRLNLNEEHDMLVNESSVVASKAASLGLINIFRCYTHLYVRIWVSPHHNEEAAMSFLPSSTQRDHGGGLSIGGGKGSQANNYFRVEGQNTSNCLKAVSRETTQILIERVANFNMALDDVSIANPTFGRECTAAIEAKQMVAHELEKISQPLHLRLLRLGDLDKVGEIRG
ncbi:prohibitin 1, partial [Tanacetum coccineum]